MTRIVHIWKPETGITDIPDALLGWKNSEIGGIRESWRLLQEQLKDSAILADFNARMGREWSIETGALERLYDIDRGTTVTLIEQGFREELIRHGSTDKPAGYVISVLKDQFEALEGVFDFVASRMPLTTSYIKQLHQVLTRHQEDADAAVPTGDPHAPLRYVKVPLTKGEWKTGPNSPMRNGTRYEYCPPVQVASEMERLVTISNAHHDQGLAPDLAAAWLHHRFTQIHPFQDGNGRVARALASLVLLRARLFPFTVQRNDSSYFDALETADQGELSALLDLIANGQRTHFKSALEAAKALSAPDLETSLEGLKARLDKSKAHQSALNAISDKVLSHCRSRFNTFRDQLAKALYPHNVETTIELNTDQVPGVEPHLRETLWFRLSAPFCVLAIAIDRSSPGHAVSVRAATASIRFKDGIHLPLQPEETYPHPFIFHASEPEDGVLARLDTWLTDLLKTTVQRIAERV